MVQDKGSERLRDYYASIDYSCETDSDCEIKDVGNCCGVCSQCVNKNARPDRGSLREICIEERIFNVCGFSAVNTCNCVENKCEGSFVEDAID